MYKNGEAKEMKDNTHMQFFLPKKKGREKKQVFYP